MNFDKPRLFKHPTGYWICAIWWRAMPNEGVSLYRKAGKGMTPQAAYADAFKPKRFQRLIQWLKG